MVFLAFCDAGAMGAIAGVNLHNARTQAVVAISSSGQMLRQIPVQFFFRSHQKIKCQVAQAQQIWSIIL